MSTLSLAQLLNNKKACSFLCINDTVQFSSLPLLIDIGKRSLKEDRAVIAVLTETSPKAWRSYFPEAKHQSIHIIDCFSDPQGWDDDDKFTEASNTITVRNLQQMEKAILKPISEKVNQLPSCTILVDSITSLGIISQHRTYQLVKTLDSLTTTDTVRLVLGLHSDMNFSSPNHNGLALKDSINRMATAIVTLEALRERTHFDTTVALTGFKPVDTFSYLKLTSNNAAKGGIARIEWRKRSGKVLFESNGFVMNASTGLLDVLPASQLYDEESDEGLDALEEGTTTPEAEAMNKLSQDVSFKLTLTDKQKEVKDSLILPYYKAQDIHTAEPEVQDESKNNNALIYYDPDAADDFDDEDPDDDLDI